MSFLPAIFLSAQSADKIPEAPVPVFQALPAPPPVAANPDNQRLYGPTSATLVPADQAHTLVEKFQAAYTKLGNPRLLVYVNRELIDTASGLKLTGHTEHYERAKSYAVKDAVPPTLADRQTVREVERLFGRPFRAAGATLADQRIASDMIGEQIARSLSGAGDQAGRDRAALGQVADVVLEILISSRNITVPAVSGDQTLTVPDIPGDGDPPEGRRHPRPGRRQRRARQGRASRPHREHLRCARYHRSHRAGLDGRHARQREIARRQFKVRRSRIRLRLFSRCSSAMCRVHLHTPPCQPSSAKSAPRWRSPCRSSSAR